MCKHLEKQLPKESGRSVRANLYKNIDRFPGTADNRSLEEKELDFRAGLLGFGLSLIHVDLLTLRYVHDWTPREISDALELGVFTVADMEKEAKMILKKKGYRG